MLRLCFVFVLGVLPIVVAADVSGTVRVIDADTIDVGDTRVRLHAIDAPEMDQSCETQDGNSFACGHWATAKVRDRFAGKVAECTPRDVDKYGRIIAKCRVNDVDMGEVIVSEGWAFAYRRYGLDYDLAEKGAFVTGRGLHGLRVQSPAAFRKEKDKVRSLGDGSCAIKRNISKNGRIFHVRGQRFYRQTKIDETRGERWFCSAAQAGAAGWRAARR